MTDRTGKNTKAIHGGLDPASHGGAVSVPIYQSSTFAFPSAEEGAARFAVYVRRRASGIAEVGLVTLGF